jgi:hypothetical protein
VVMAKTRLMGLDAFFFLAGIGAVPITALGRTRQTSPSV